MSGYPFVNRKRKIVNQINSTPTIIFGNNQHTCAIESIILINTSENNCIINIYNLTELEEEATQVTLKNNINLPAFEMVNILQEMSPINTEIEDVFFAYSDASYNNFNSIVNYIEFTQLP